MNIVKGTPAYWQRFLFEVLAMVKQLGLPTFFLTLKCADLMLNDLVSCLSYQNSNGLNRSEEGVDALSYVDRSNKVNFLDQTKSDFQVLKNISQILNELELTESEYYEAFAFQTPSKFLPYK